MPVTIGIFIAPGNFPATEPGGKPRSNRSVEYDTPDNTYARFLLEEILPEVGKQYKLTDRPEERLDLRRQQRRHLRVQGGLGAA